MNILEQVAERCKDSIGEFEHRAVFFIPSESYCAATITIIEGLYKLGFKIYVPYKRNINSWFCDIVTADPVEFLEENPIDFAISNLHWGTRWDYYERLGLLNHTKVLLDGDDSRNGLNWFERYNGWCAVYKRRPDEETCARLLQPYRWMEPLGNYWPDVVFSSQKAPQDDAAVYLPFGIHSQYMNSRQCVQFDKRSIDFVNVPGDGPKRIKMTNFLNQYGEMIPGVLHNAPIRGSASVPSAIAHLAPHDKNIHSYHRWASYADYHTVLGNSKVFIYPGVFDFPQWDSKRQWEAYANGCLVLYERPTVDMSSYPVTELYEDGVFDSHYELIDKCKYLYSNPELLERIQETVVCSALFHFSPAQLALRFLYYVKEST
jgi:hypothetical protein